MWNLLVKRARIEGFLVADYRPRYHEAQAEIGEWIDQGKIKYKIDERKGFDILPETINCLFEGNHDGRLLVELTDEDNAQPRSLPRRGCKTVHVCNGQLGQIILIILYHLKQKLVSV